MASAAATLAVAAVMRGLAAGSSTGAGRAARGLRTGVTFGARARASRHSATEAPRLASGSRIAERPRRPTHWNPNSLAASAVTPKTAPATTQEPMLPSAARNAIAEASPQPPTHRDRSRPTRPSNAHSSKSSRTANTERTTNGAVGLPRTRFQAQDPESSGTPRAAIQPTPHTKVKASSAPTGPQALSALQGDAKGSGAW